MVSPVVIVLQFISGVFFVYSELPSWMQDIAAVFPLKWLAQGMRSVFLPESFAAQEVGGSWQLPADRARARGLDGRRACCCALRTFRWLRRDARLTRGERRVMMDGMATTSPRPGRRGTPTAAAPARLGSGAGRLEPVGRRLAGRLLG